MIGRWPRLLASAQSAPLLSGFLIVAACGAPHPSADSGPVDASWGDGATDAGEVIVRGCTSEACDLITNGCDAGSACYYLPLHANAPPQPRCATAGDNGVGSICDGQHPCAPGLGCDVRNRCRNYCCAPGERTGCPPGEACVVEFRDNNDEGLGVGICQTCATCDPITAAGCGATEACYPAGNDGSCLVCAPPRSNGRAGSACSTSSDCRPGLGCLPSSPPRCATYCSVLDGGGCASGERCTAIGYTGLPDLGFCVPR